MGSGGEENPADINLSPGEIVECNFTNTQRASLTVVKMTGGEDDLFCFDAVLPDGADSFCIQTTGGIGELTEINLVPGEYGITEQSLENWILLSDLCSDTSNAGDFVLSPGEDLSCTFVNQRIYPPVAVNAAWAMLLLVLVLLAGGWYFRPAKSVRF